MDAARRAGLDVEKLSQAPVEGFRSGPCLHFPRQAQFHPLRYLDGLLDGFTRAGGRVHGGVRAVKVTGGSRRASRPPRGTRSPRRRSSSRPTLRSWTCSRSTRSRRRTTPTPSRRACLTASVTPALYWDTRDPYHYVRLERTTNAALGGDNGEPVDLLIVGGEDHKTGQAHDSERALRRARDLDARALPLGRRRPSTAGPDR